MSKKKNIEPISTSNLPNALIIGGSHIAGYLASTFRENDCLVRMENSYSLHLGRFDYIFQFGNFNLVDSAVQRHLAPSGKFLYVETDPEPNLSKKERVRIIRIGDIMLWDKEELKDKILRTMFSIKSPAIVDVRRKPHFTSRLIPTKKKITLPGVKKPTVEPSTKPVGKTRVIRKRRIITFGIVVFLGLLAFFGAAYWYLLLVKNTASSFRSHLASSNWQALSSDIKTAKQQLLVAKGVYNVSSSVFFFLSNTAVFQDASNMLTSSSDFLSAAEDFLSFSKEILKRNPSFFSKDKGITKTELELLKNKVDSLYYSLTTAKKELERVSTPFFPKESFIPLLSAASDKLLSTREVLPLVEQLFFDQQTKVYLVLFQNSMELRPTGGFIGSFALLTVGDGKIIDFKIEDVYTADGQLKGHVDPPLPIRKYLSQPHFFLRDSNFDPDFALSAVKGGWFLEKELGTKVDGVIGINLLFVQRLLRVVGSLTIADFKNEEVNSDNFFFKTHFFTREDFFPGSTQKRDFLTSVANALVQKLSFDKQVAWVDLFAVIKQALEEKDILIYADDEKIQKLVEERGWGGRLVEVKCVQSQDSAKQADSSQNENGCMADYLSVIEANLGVNKANYFVSKSVTVEKKISDGGRITSLVTLSYQNTATPEVFPDSIYVNYLRLFVPAGSQLLSVALNNVSLAASDIDVENYGTDKAVYGFLVRIAPGNKAVVKVAYTLPFTIGGKTSSYQLFFQKQGGDKTSALVLSVTFPSELKFQPLNFKSASSRENEIFYTTDTSVDRIFVFERK